MPTLHSSKCCVKGLYGASPKKGAVVGREIHPAMQCVDDARKAAKRGTMANKGTEFGMKCAIFAMAGDMMLEDMTMPDFLGMVIAEVEAYQQQAS